MQELQENDELDREVGKAPALILFADTDARVDLGRPLLGEPLSHRLAAAARDAGFSKVYVAPGLASIPPGASEIGVGESFGQPVLLAWEGSYIDPALLRLMIAHPLEEDERFAIYDKLGRPSGCFCGRLERVPGLVPVAEELDLPPPHGPASLVRVVDPEDVHRAQVLILGSETQLDLEGSSFNRTVGLRSLALLARTRLTLAQLELLALILVVACAPMLLLLGWPGLVGAGALLMFGVHVARLLRPLGELSPRTRSIGAVADYAPGETLADLVRPVGHAAFIGSSTYLLIGPVDRSSVAALVLLAAGASTVLLNVARVRHLLRQGVAERLALARLERLVSRLGLRLPSALVQAPLLELVVMLTCAFGHVGIPWTICVVAASTRLWPWFVAPVESARTSPGMR